MGIPLRSLHRSPEAVRAGLETAPALLLFVLIAAYFGVFARIDHVLYDAALVLKERPAPSDIVIVAIDEQSLRERGPWPWSRRVHADLVERLARAGSAVVAFDVLFSEPQEHDSGADEQFARAMAASGRVVLPVYPGPDPQFGGLREMLPIPALRDVAAALGHVDLELDADSIVRRVFLYGGEGAARWPALALAANDVAAGRARAAVSSQGDGSARWLRRGEMLIPFAGGAGRFTRVSASDVLRDQAVADRLKGRLVLVGATAAGLQRDFATPASGFGQPLAGVEIQANILDAVRRDAGLRDAPWYATVLLAILPLLIGVYAFGRASARSGLLFSTLLLLLVGGASFVLLHGARLWVSPTPALLAVLLAYPVYTWRRVESTARALAAEQLKSEATLHAIGDAVLSIDPGGYVVYANALAERIFGTGGGQVRGEPVGDLLRCERQSDRDRFDAMLDWEIGSAASPSVLENVAISNRRGEHFDVRIAASPVRPVDGKVGSIVVAVTDLTASVSMARRIEHQATHDSVTGLPNRTLLGDRVAHALSAAQRDGKQVAVLFLDLDDFKRVNDGFGHAVGDQVLRQIAQRLAAGSRANDTVARWGGDEFVLVVEDLPDADAAAVVAHKLLERLSVPFNVLDCELGISASIGISIFPRDGTDAHTLVQHADRAMYRAKQLGGNQIQFDSELMDRRAGERRELERGLRGAIARDELLLYFQPQVDMATNAICSAEALMRWEHPKLGMLLPDRFIPVAEQAGMIHEIGAWALRAACKRAAAWPSVNARTVSVAVNVSARQLLGHDLVPALHQALAASSLDPMNLTLEITESVMMHDLERVAATLHEIHALGVRIAIDDLGTGFSSLSLLRGLPIAQVKIDRSFVANIPSDGKDAAIARGVIVIGRGMGLDVVAEGVETAAQFAFMREHGCTVAQGYYIGRPVPEAEFVAALHASAMTTVDGNRLSGSGGR